MPETLMDKTKGAGSIPMRWKSEGWADWTPLGQSLFRTICALPATALAAGVCDDGDAVNSVFDAHYETFLVQQELTPLPIPARNPTSNCCQAVVTSQFDCFYPSVDFYIALLLFERVHCKSRLSILRR